jgi:hypothetical protein
MTLKDWQARWGHHVPAQAIAELTAILSPVMPSPSPTARHSEAAGAAQIRLAAGRAGVPVWRNNQGGCTDQTGRLIRFGLGNESPALNARWKSSDLIGILPVVVQPSHVGKTLGVFLAVETKKPGWRLTPGDKRGQAQAAFLQSVRGFGGVGGFCCTAEDFLGLAQRTIVMQGNTPTAGERP